MPAAEAVQPHRRLYGRRQGPKLKPARKRALVELLPVTEFTVPLAGNLDPGTLFLPPPRPIWLEIGFGGGEHLAWQAMAHPKIGLLGVEPFINGVARFLTTCDQQGLTNVRVLMDDARLLLKALPDASIDRLFVLFPDPWPKLRHQKRRIVNPDTVADMARVMRSGAELCLATDHEDYGRAMLATVLNQPAFAWTARRADDWRQPWDGWSGTRYEAKALAAGRRPLFLRFVRGN